MNTKMVNRLKTRVATETLLSDFAGPRHAAAVAQPGMRTPVRCWFGATGPVGLPHNHLLVCATGNLAARIGARARRIPTRSDAR